MQNLYNVNNTSLYNSSNVLLICKNYPASCSVKERWEFEAEQDYTIILGQEKFSTWNLGKLSHAECIFFFFLILARLKFLLSKELTTNRRNYFLFWKLGTNKYTVILYHIFKLWGVSNGLGSLSDSPQTTFIIMLLD